jgi:hypothetical protein
MANLTRRPAFRFDFDRRLLLLPDRRALLDRDRRALLDRDRRALLELRLDLLCFLLCLALALPFLMLW